MNGKKITGITITLLVLVAFAWTAMAAMSIGGEASNLDAMLKTAIQNREPADSVLEKVRGMGYEMKPSADPSNPQAIQMTGKGPDHWAVVYRTWLTLNVQSDPDGKTRAYHIDRVGSVF